MFVEIRNNNLDRGLRLLKRKLAEDGIWQILRDKRAYEKPSDKKRRLARAAVVRHRKDVRERQD